MTKPQTISEANHRTHDNFVAGSKRAEALGDPYAAARLMYSAALALPKNSTGAMAMDKALRMFEQQGRKPEAANGTDVAIYATETFIAGMVARDKR